MLREPTTGRVENGGPKQAPPSTQRSIFRTEARRHYIQNQERVHLPRLASPRTFKYLWILALLLTLVGSIIAFWPLIWQVG